MAETPSPEELHTRLNGGGVFVAFDTETTGLSPVSDRLTEIGAVKFDRHGIMARFSTLIDPGIPIPPEITELTGISNSMTDGKPPAEAAVEDFLRFAGGMPLIAHNAGFDISFLTAALSAAGKPAPGNQVIDSKLMAGKVFPGLKSYSLQKLAAGFGINVISAHRAEDDARVCMELFLLCLNKELNESAGGGINPWGLSQDQQENPSCRP